VVDKELKRIKVFADQENDRILELRRQNEAEEACPICLEVIPAIWMEGGELVEHMVCCGVRYHQQCLTNWQMRREIHPTMTIGCFYCRRSFSDTSDRGKMILLEEVALTGSTVSKANALAQVGSSYEHGTGGKKINLEKALTCYEKAAELGHAQAQVKVAWNCHSGEFHKLSILKSPEKAIDMAKRAVDQGNPRAQVMLGTFVRQPHDIDMGACTEAHRLFALSAYQGDISGMIELERFYHKQLANQEGKKGNKSIIREIRECLLLRFYWAGRVCNKKEHELPRSEVTLYMMIFVSQFGIMMRELWHSKRPCFELDPLTGYSHIPLLTSIHSKVKKGCHDEELDICVQDEFSKLSVQLNMWKQHMCANCGKQGGGNECVLKTCARCKAFSYCSKECQVKHWKAGHKVDCKGRHWIESYFPNIRMPK
jgi:hypothetical protein